MDCTGVAVALLLFSIENIFQAMLRETVTIVTKTPGYEECNNCSEIAVTLTVFWSKTIPNAPPVWDGFFPVLPIFLNAEEDIHGTYILSSTMALKL